MLNQNFNFPNVNFQPAPRDEVRPLLETSERAARDRDFLRSIELLEKASALAPTNVNILLNLGGIHGKRYDYAAAVECFEKAAKVAEDKSQVLALAGGRCMKFGRFDLAKGFFKRAIDQSRVFPVAFVGLAEICEREDRLEEAAGLIERALHQHPDYAPARLVRARLHRRVGEGEKARNILEAMLKDPQCKLILRSEAGCELGKILDGQGEFDAAMSAFVQAKSLLRSPEVVLAEQRKLEEPARDMEANVSAADLRQWFEAGRNTFQPGHRLAVLGGQLYHAETTALERAFDSHPDIFHVEDSRVFLDDVIVPVRRKSPETASRSFLQSLSDDTVQRMREIYFQRTESFLGRKLEGRLLIEKNHILNYLLPAMMRLFPEARFLLMVRDPRDACLDSFMQFMPINSCSAAFLTLESTVAEQVVTMNFWRTFMARTANPHREIRHEDLTANPKSAGRSVFDFLGIKEGDPAFGDLGKATVPTPSIGRWRNYERHLEPHLDKLNTLAQALGYE